MAGDGVRGGEGLQRTSAGATREDGDSSGNLWRCRRDRFPKSISGHQNYYLWGPREYTGESLIFLHYDLEDVQRWCQSVQVGPKLDPYYGMGEEHYTILVCNGLKKPL